MDKLILDNQAIKAVGNSASLEIGESTHVEILVAVGAMTGTSTITFHVEVIESSSNTVIDTYDGNQISVSSGIDSILLTDTDTIGGTIRVTWTGTLNANNYFSGVYCRIATKSKKISRSIVLSDTNGDLKRKLILNNSNQVVMQDEHGVEITNLESNHIITETFTGVLSADDDYVLIATAGDGTSKEVTVLTHGILDRVRGVSIQTSDVDSPSGNVIVDGTGLDDLPLQESIAISAGGLQYGVKMFKTITKVTIPSTVHAGDTVSVGISQIIRLVTGIPKVLIGITLNGSTPPYAPAGILNVANKSIDIQGINNVQDVIIVSYIT
jgi:hypothetical protein